MPSGDIFECNVDQTYAGQNMTNVLHFQQVGDDGTGTALVAISGIWVVFFKNLHAALLVDAVNIVQLRIRQVLPIQTQQLIFPIGQQGDVTEGGLPPQQCAILQQKGQRGGVKGRRGAGHMKISGVPDNVVDTGRINANYAGDMNALGDEFAKQITDSPSGFKFDSVVLSQIDDVARVIQFSGPASRIRTVYSRTIGVGI